MRSEFGQRAELRPVGDVAAEEDEPGRIGIAKGGALLIGQREAGEAEEGCKHGAI